MRRLERRNSRSNAVFGVVSCVVPVGAIIYFFILMLISGKISHTISSNVVGFGIFLVIAIFLIPILIRLSISSMKKLLDRSVKLLIDDEGIRNGRMGDFSAIPWQEVRYIELKRAGSQFNEYAYLSIDLASGTRAHITVSDLDQPPHIIANFAKDIWRGPT